MIFTLEALQAKEGDCLLLHYGPNGAPRLAVIDGGATGVFGASLGPRLAELRDARGDGDLLPISLVMVSHTDRDHISGVLDMFGGMRRDRDDGRDEAWQVDGLWFNAFEDLVADPHAGSTAVAGAVLGAAVGPGGVAAPGVRSAAIVASIGQAAKLRDLARGLGIASNPPFGGGLVRSTPPGEAPRRIALDGGVQLTVVGPDEQRLRNLQEDWKRERGRAEEPVAAAAKQLDDSVYNLSSIVVLAEADGKTLLLTGDALGDDVLAGLRAAKLLDRTLPLDVLKVPHHGSDRNVTPAFFEALPARHYVVSGDGTDGNPEPATLEMIAAARGEEPYTLHLTYREGKKQLGEHLTAFLAAREQAGRPVDVRFAEPGRPLRIDLGDPLPGGP